MKKLIKKIACSLAAVIVTGSFIACGSSSYDKGYVNNAAVPSYEESYYGGYEDSYYEDSYDYETSTSNKDESNEKLADSSRKLIKTYNLSVETETFDDFLADLEKHILELNGYIQNMDTYNGSSYSSSYSSSRYSKLTVRVPAKSLEAFVNFVGNAANIKNKNLSVEDVTLSYVDTVAKKSTLLTEQERLLALLEKAENIDDIITIESRLSEVRYKLESQESIIRTYDNLVDYATVYLSIDEVKKYSAPEPVGYWEEVAQSFKDGVESVVRGLQNFFVGFVGALPSLVVFALVVAIVVGIWKLCSKKRKNKAKKNGVDAASKLEMAKNNARKKAEENAK